MPKLRKSDQFLISIGHAMTVWSQLEGTLARYFAIITRMDTTVARRVFFSATGFRGRTAMIEAALGSPTTKFANTVEDQFVRLFVRKANSYATVRNIIAHDAIVFFGFEGHKYSNEYVLVDGKYDRFPADIQALTEKDVKKFHKNISDLFVVGQRFLQRAPGDDVSAEKYLSLLQKLPNAPCDTGLDHTEKEILLLLETDDLLITL